MLQYQGPWGDVGCFAISWLHTATASCKWESQFQSVSLVGLVSFDVICHITALLQVLALQPNLGDRGLPWQKIWSQ